ncbi:MAG: hypothetical protein ACK4WF_01700 [Candidatus Brocadiales bacterium]
MNYISALMLCISLLIPSSQAAGGDTLNLPKGGEANGLTVGALYYLWWGLLPGDKNTWNLGHSLTPELGEYNSRDTCVAEQHLQWASQYGINLLEVSWAGPGKRDPSLDNDDIDLALKEGLLGAPSIAKVKFLLVYETEKALGAEAEKLGYDPKRAFVEDILYANQNYFNHDGYFRLGGRPVVMIWKTRATLDSLLQRAGHELSAVFKEIERACNQDLFWVGLGEDIYNPKGPDAEEPLLKVVDGIAPLLGDDFPAGGEKPWREYLDHITTSYALWQSAAKRHGFIFIPSALPGFDDRGFKLGQNRSMKMDPGNFSESVRLAKEVADSGSRWVSIYGFNEWFESGGIEPTKEYGMLFLTALRSALGGAGD